MNTLLKIECIKCNRSAEITEQIRQEKLAQASLASSRVQTLIQEHPIPTNQLTLSSKLSSKKEACVGKLSLKNFKKNSVKSTDYSKMSSKQSVHQLPTQQRCKSPNIKINIMYQQSSFSPLIKCQQPPQQNLFRLFRQENATKIYNLNNSKQRSEPLHYQPMIQQLKQQTSSQDRRNMFRSEQPKEQIKTKEYFLKELDQKKEQLPDENTKVVRKKVHFNQLKQNQNKQQRQHTYRDTYSAFGSILNTNRNISQDDLEEINYSDKTLIGDNQHIIQETQIDEKNKHQVRNQVRKMDKKNMTVFQEQFKKFVGLRTVYTLKSMDSPSERSFLDLNFMQKQDGVFRNKLLK